MQRRATVFRDGRLGVLLSPSRPCTRKVMQISAPPAGHHLGQTRRRTEIQMDRIILFPPLLDWHASQPMMKCIRLAHLDDAVCKVGRIRGSACKRMLPLNMPDDKTHHSARNADVHFKGPSVLARGIGRDFASKSIPQLWL